MTDCAGAICAPVMLSRWLGAMFQTTGVAATQNSLVVAPAAGAAASAAAPVSRRAANARGTPIT